MALDSGLSAECADVLGVLGDFHLLYLFSERCTVSVIREIQRLAFSPLSQFMLRIRWLLQMDLKCAKGEDVENL